MHGMGGSSRPDLLKTTYRSLLQYRRLSSRLAVCHSPGVTEDLVHEEGERVLQPREEEEVEEIGQAYLLEGTEVWGEGQGRGGERRGEGRERKERGRMMQMGCGRGC